MHTRSAPVRDEKESGMNTETPGTSQLAQWLNHLRWLVLSVPIFIKILGIGLLLTTAPGPDIAPYHDRQIVTFAPQAGMDWLTLSRPQRELLAPPPAGRLVARTLRRDGVEMG